MIAIADFSRDTVRFSYDTWKDNALTNQGLLLISGDGVTSHGGAGSYGTWDLSALPNGTLELLAQRGPAHQARSLNLVLSDADKTKRSWQFDLTQLATTGVTVLLSAGAADLSRPTAVGETGAAPGLDLAHITMWQVQGAYEYQHQPMDVAIAAIRVRSVPPQRPVAPLPRTPDSPQVAHVAAAAPDIIGITITAGRVLPHRLVPYVPHPDDTLIIAANKQGIVDKRTVRRGKIEIGWLAGPDTNVLCEFQQFKGQELQAELADWVHGYRISSTDDANYTNPVAPRAVHRKSKPTDWTRPSRQPAMRHTLYLHLPHALQPGCTYEIDCGDLNIQTPRLTYLHVPARTRSEAVHVSHIGFRPDDPVKRAFVSLWLGTGGGYSFSTNTRFFVLDDHSGRAVFTGSMVLAKAAHEPEQMRDNVNYNHTDVYRLDFDAMSSTGRYRVCLDGVGCSYPFGIAHDVWSHAAGTVLQGIYHHRSGVALGSPYTSYQRPRCFHPDDGMQIHQSRATLMDTSMGLNLRNRDSFSALVEDSTDVVVTQAWGGMMDAADWDRRAQHLEVTMTLVEMLDLYPAFWNAHALPIPEHGNGLPDIANEALWILDFFTRLQLPDGSVCGGVESASHPISGEPSWLESLPVFVYAPDVWSSYLYAASAARAGRVLAPHDAARAAQYATNALRAMAWAEAHKDDVPEARRAGAVRDARNLAALELLRLTRDKRWHGVFAQDTCLRDLNYDPRHGTLPQSDALFAYALLDNELADPLWQDTARAALLAVAEFCMTYARGNAYNLTAPVQTMPHHMGFYSSPKWAVPLVRGYVLSTNAAYLAAIVAACQYSAGANPMNQTYCTGLGHAWPNVFHIDSRVSGQPQPAGIIPYGQYDLVIDMHRNNNGFTWPYVWFFSKQCTPDGWIWPATEGYFDTGSVPSIDEYTPQQTMAPTVYVWGFLAARNVE